MQSDSLLDIPISETIPAAIPNKKCHTLSTTPYLRTPVNQAYNITLPELFSTRVTASDL